MMTTREAAELLGFAEYTLRKWRCYGRGPRYVRCHGNTVRYRIEDLKAWQAEGLARAA